MSNTENKRVRRTTEERIAEIDAKIEEVVEQAIIEALAWHEA